MARNFITRLPIDVDHDGRLTALGVPVWMTSDARTGRLPDSLFWRIDAALQAKAAAEGSDTPVGLHHAVWLLRCRRCNAPFIGPSEARMCSDACRSAAKRDTIRRASAKRTLVRKAALGRKTFACGWRGSEGPAARTTWVSRPNAARQAWHRARRGAAV